MNEVQRKVLRVHHGDILKNLVLDTDILGFFLQKDILTEAMVHSIQAKSTQHEKIIEMLFLLPKRGPKSFPLFLEAVKKHSPYLCEKLELEYEKELKATKWAEKVADKAEHQKPNAHQPNPEVAVVENIQAQPQSQKANPSKEEASEDRPAEKATDTLTNEKLVQHRTATSSATSKCGSARNRSMSISSANHVMTSSIMQQNLNNLFIKLKAKLEAKNIREPTFCTPEPATFKSIDKLLDDLFHIIDEQETIFSQCHALLGGKDRNYPLVSHIINMQRAKRELEQDLRAKEQQKNKYGDHISKLENRCRNQATEISHLTAEVKKLKEELEQLQAINSEREEKQKIIDELRKMVMEADTNKKSKLRSSYLALHYDGNVTEIKQLRAEIRNLKADNENLKTENLMLKKSENLKKLVKLREDGNPRHEEISSAVSHASDDSRESVHCRTRQVYPVQPVMYQREGSGSAKSIENERPKGYFSTHNSSRAFMRASAEQLTTCDHEESASAKPAKARDKDVQELDFKFSNQNGSLGQKRSPSKDRSSKRVTFYGDDNTFHSENKDNTDITRHVNNDYTTVFQDISSLPNGTSQNQNIRPTTSQKAERPVRGRQPKPKHSNVKGSSRRSASLNSVTSNREIIKMSSHLIQKSRNLRQPVGH